MSNGPIMSSDRRCHNIQPISSKINATFENRSCYITNQFLPIKCILPKIHLSALAHLNMKFYIYYKTLITNSLYFYSIYNRIYKNGEKLADIFEDNDVI